MAISDAYATPAEYRAEIGMTDDGADEAIASALLAVSRYLDRKLSQAAGFNQDAEPTKRIYWCAGGRVEVDAIASMDGLEVRTAEDSAGIDAADPLPASGYRLYPLNADKGPEPRPWTTVELVSARPQLIEVTAIHGWPSVPGAIKRATIQLTAMLRIDSPFATERINEMPESEIGASPQARAILRGLSEVYNRYPIGVG